MENLTPTKSKTENKNKETIKKVEKKPSQNPD
jgi:hypothetical protein